MKTALFLILSMAATVSQAQTICASMHVGAPNAVDGSDDNRPAIIDFKSTVNVDDAIVISPDHKFSVVSDAQGRQLAKSGNTVVIVTGNGSDAVGLSAVEGTSLVSAYASEGVFNAELSNGVSIDCYINNAK